MAEQYFMLLPSNGRILLHTFFTRDYLWWPWEKTDKAKAIFQSLIREGEKNLE